MKPMWVSRFAFDALVLQFTGAHQLIRDTASRHEREMAQCHATFDAEMDRAEKRFSDLMASYRLLKLQGFTEAAPPPPKAEPRIVDPVENAIRAACAGKDANVYAAMRAQVAADRANDVPPEQIIANIHRGSRPAEEEAV